MDIKQEHIAYKKTIGKLDGKPVFELGTTGGLHLVIVSKGGSTEVKGTGPHPEIARYIAQKQEPKIQYTELSKSDYMEPYLFMPLVPEYERLTDMVQKAWGRK